MTAERIDEALKRSCYHLNLARLLHEGTLIWSGNWICLDCQETFEVSSTSEKDKTLAASALGIDEVFDEVLKQWVRH